ncbi:MAG: hypothetical protein ACAF41_11930 [Leptolyngbya sp. BL-A-14]
MTQKQIAIASALALIALLLGVLAWKTTQADDATKASQETNKGYEKAMCKIDPKQCPK